MIRSAIVLLLIFAQPAFAVDNSAALRDAWRVCSKYYLGSPRQEWSDQAPADCPAVKQAWDNSGIEAADQAAKQQAQQSSDALIIGNWKKQ